MVVSLITTLQIVQMWIISLTYTHPFRWSPILCLSLSNSGPDYCRLEPQRTTDLLNPTFTLFDLIPLVKMSKASGEKGSDGNHLSSHFFFKGRGGKKQLSDENKWQFSFADCRAQIRIRLTLLLSDDPSAAAQGFKIGFSWREEGERAHCACAKSCTGNTWYDNPHTACLAWCWFTLWSTFQI